MTSAGLGWLRCPYHIWKKLLIFICELLPSPVVAVIPLVVTVTVVDVLTTWRSPNQDANVMLETVTARSFC